MDSSIVRLYAKAADLAEMIESQPWFTHTITITILIVGVCTGVAADMQFRPSTSIVVINAAALGVFTLEMITKIVACRWRPLRYFGDSWNVFDFFIVFVSYLEYGGVGVGGLATLRLLRLLRVFRLMKALPRLRSIVESLVMGFGSCFWIVALMGIFNYLVACVGVIMFGESDPFHFGTVGSALFSIYRIETLDSWDQILRINIYGCAVFPGGYPMLSEEDNGALSCSNSRSLGWFAVAYFIFVVIFGALVLPTMLIGIVAISFSQNLAHAEAEKEDLEKSKDKVRIVKKVMPAFFTDQRVECMHALFIAMDADKGGSLDLNEIVPVLKYICERHFFVRVSEEEIDMLCTHFDEDNSSDMNFGKHVAT